MNIINTFYGALLGIWLTISVQKAVMEGKWLSVLPIVFGLMTIHGLFEVSRFSTPHKKITKIVFFLMVIGSSFSTSFFAEAAGAPDTLVLTFLRLPKAWFFAIIVGFWFLSMKAIRKEF